MATRVAVIKGHDDAPKAAYPPSWVNVLNDWIERLPGPAWIAYLALMAGGFAISAGAAVSDPFSSAYYGPLPFAVLFLISHLDQTARRALRSLRPLLDLEDPGVAEVEFRLTVVPARPAALILLAIALVTPLPYLVDPVGQSVANLAPVPLILRYVWETFIASSMLILVYHTLRQLRLFDRLHDRVTHVDLFDQAPIFGFSSVSSRTAIGLVLLLVPSVFLIPSGAGVGTIASTLIWYAVAVLFAAAAFVLPVRGVHGLLAAEKGRLQAEIGRRLTATLSEIHMAVDANDGEEVDKRNRAMSTLMAERELVSKVPTWPWSASALTGFVSAVLLPIGLWIVTRVLERIV